MEFSRLKISYEAHYKNAAASRTTQAVQPEIKQKVYHRFSTYYFIWNINTKNILFSSGNSSFVF